ncbi:Ethanolamine ammonia-lyase light chain [Clostridium formicaceticum]|uniref:Ethanolamine ammonia-lyase small subunit n=2 Tax=Clostridium formicaceticum TaxID=1497 RepID=A0AAC9RIG9_9CLOT|nr:ethanolamine ammonia-lyase subunit EutC [Clostridium formicaceticum]AOY75789.1 ethanolamine ammonia-lyase [Clostridium formicaceticum]ARE86117.1 Ethanolamine ammonia-lyase light chain [Clostridium formicaceticum]
MVSEQAIKDMVQQIIQQLSIDKQQVAEEKDLQNTDTKVETEVPLDDTELKDLTEIKMQDYFAVPDPANKEVYLGLKESTPARVGIWRAGPRYRTETLLRFRADHAVAMDAVFTYVSEKFLEEMGLFSVSTLCRDKDEYVTRPDLGRKFSEEAIATIKERCVKNPQVQIYVSDGLSSTAIEANVKDILPSIMQGLENYGLKAGTPFFVKHGRVPAMDVVSEALDAQVTIVLIGERPGLATGESMSCYMAYRAKVGMPESRRTVISNIHKGGTSATEAGAHIAHIIKEMIEQKASGLDLKL